MNTALGLMVLALSLLTQVSSNPSLPKSFRDTAIQVANQAIDEANKQLATQSIPQSTSQSTVQPISSATIQQITQPTFGATQITMPDIKKEVQVDTEATMVNVNGTYVNLFAFYREDGKALSDVPVTLTSDDGVSMSVNTGPNGYKHGEPAAFIQYRPLKAGNRSITLTANGVSKTITVRGQIDKCVDTENGSECNSQ